MRVQRLSHQLNLKALESPTASPGSVAAGCAPSCPGQFSRRCQAVGLGQLVCLCRLLLQCIRVVKDSSNHCHGNWSSIPLLRGGSSDARAAVVDTRKMEKVVVAPSRSRGISAQIRVTSAPSENVFGLRGPSWQLWEEVELVVVLLLSSWKVFLDVPVLYLRCPWGTRNLGPLRYSLGVSLGI